MKQQAGRVFWAVLKISLLVVFLALMSSVHINSEKAPLLAGVVSIVLAVVGMFVIPALIVKSRKEKLSSFGLRLPENMKKAALYAALVFLVMFPALIVFSRTSSFQDFYVSTRGLSVDNFFLEVVFVPVFYFFAEEFLFRGFFFFSVFKRVGVHALWATSLIFALLHIGKPVPEVIFSFFAGILLCFLSYKTKSFLPSFVVHFLISILTNAFIIFVFI